jgi:hypothetical protein
MPQPTQATAYLEQLQLRRDSQAALKMPRSQSSWEAEQNRLGSWHSGQGELRPPGVGPSVDVGHGRPLFDTQEERGK